ncbi:MAG: hypothetical protein AAFX02_01690 [Pseudomonadota bacterium]
MIRFTLVIAAVLTFFSTFAHADTRSLYTITDLQVDERAETVIVAQQNAFAAARLAGATLMIERITLPEDRATAGTNLAMTQELANWLAAAVDVQEEARGGNRYRATLSVVFNPRNVRDFLDRYSVAYVDSQAPLSLAVPIVGTGVDVYGSPVVLEDGTESYNGDLMWLSVWGDRNANALAHYETTGAVYQPNAGWVDVQDEVLLRQAQRAFTAILTGRPGAYRVTVETLTASGRLPVGTTLPQQDIKSAALAAQELLDESWKRQVVVRTEDTTFTEANIYYASLAEWNTLRSALSRSPLVSGFQIRAVARDGAVVNFAYASDLRRLALDLRQRGVAMEVDPSGLVLSSARLLAIPGDASTQEGPIGQN